jgi:hypothetical protein
MMRIEGELHTDTYVVSLVNRNRVPRQADQDLG